MWEACWGHSPKLGSLGHPFSFTPRGLVSMRKCLTSSLVMSPGKRQDVLTSEPPHSSSHPPVPHGNQCSSLREGSLPLCTGSSNPALCTGSTPSQAPPKPKSKMQMPLSPPQLRAEGVWRFPVPWRGELGGRDPASSAHTQGHNWFSRPSCPLAPAKRWKASRRGMEKGTQYLSCSAA